MFFTGEEQLPNKTIGLNELQRKLLIIEDNNAGYDLNIIDLEEVKSCLVTKVYRSIDAGGLKTKRVEEYLRMLYFNLTSIMISHQLILKVLT